jgi:hypothetical protein
MPFITEYASFISNDNRENARRAAEKIIAGLAKHERTLRGILFYAATNYDAKILVDAVHRAFPGVTTFGCTTSGEFSDGHMLKNSVIAMGMDDDAMDLVAVAGVANSDTVGDPAAIAFASLESRTGLRMRELDFRKYAGWILLDGLANHNDELVERLGELTDVVFAGGCAGDDGHWRQTLVWANGTIYENGALFVLMKPARPFAVVKTQRAQPTGSAMTATRADREARIIHEFDDRPAAQVYAEAMGVDLSRATYAGKTSRELYAEKFIADGEVAAGGERTVTKDAFIDMFITWPLALMIGGDPFIRAATNVVEGGGIQVFMPPVQGVRYAVCRAGDVVSDMRRVLHDKKRELGNIAGVMMCGCLLREIQIRNEDRVGAFEELFKDLPVSGFSSYGEIYVSVVSQSASMILFS